MTRNELTEKLRRIVSIHLGVPEHMVIETSEMEDDLGADDLDMIELIMDCELVFNIEIPEEEFGDEWKTFKDLVDVIASKQVGRDPVIKVDQKE